MKEQKNDTYKSFGDSFLHPAINTLNNAIEPRVGEEIKKIMQLTDQVRTTDWYLYQN